MPEGCPEPEMTLSEQPIALLVDDNEATCTLINAILKPYFTIEVASNGDDAIDKVTSRPYSIVLLDLRMPQRDGYAVLEHIQRESPDLLHRVIVVTAALTDVEVARARAFGIFDIVRKPFEVDHLLSVVLDCLGKRGDEAEPIEQV